MGANRKQGWALLLFLVGFTFFPAGLFALGPLFTIAGLVCLVASALWFIQIKPLEHGEPKKKLEAMVPETAKARHAV